MVHTVKTVQNERRRHERVPVALDAVLYYNTLMLPDCHIWNISPEGAFVSTSGHHIPDRAVVDLAISGAQGGMPQRFQGTVMRTTEQGVGVRLRDVNPDSVRTLVQTLYAV